MPSSDGSAALLLREVEVSITARCTLACAECGFLVPRQPEPSLGDVLNEVSSSLIRLRDLGVRASSLALLGGEPTLDGRLLSRAVRAVRDTGFADRLELVTNGLTPRGAGADVLRAIDRLTISVYGLSDELLDLWRRWVAAVAPYIEVVLRRHESGWDPWSMTTPPAAPEQAQALFDTCWYKRHCVTIERGRLFLCSRVAKLARDDEGLALDDATTLADVRAYLGRPSALPSCATCTPMMGLPTVPAGVQPDDRIARLEPRAVAWLQRALDTKVSDGPPTSAP